MGNEKENATEVIGPFQVTPRQKERYRKKASKAAKPFATWVKSRLDSCYK